MVLNREKAELLIDILDVYVLPLVMEMSPF